VRKKYRQYEATWERDHTFPEIIKNAWPTCGVITDIGDVGKAPKEKMDKLNVWSITKFDNIRLELHKSRAQLE
jgi:hypothetical protein